MPEQYQVKVTVGDAEIEVQGAQEGVVEIVRALSEILSGRPGRVADAAAPVSASDAPSRSRVIDARSFFQEKAPSSQSEAIAVAAFYITELAPPDKRATSINKERAAYVFRQAKYPLPKRTDQVLVNALNAGYLDRVGPGEYQLSPVGFNLVEHTLGTDV
jgi:hypothetical protein